MNKKSKNVPISEFSAEDGADDLLSSPEMHPYARLMMKGMVDGNTVESELTEIAAMPLEKRYVWRIASALKWGFADFDDFTVAADRDTLKPGGFRQGDGSADISPDPILHVHEGPGRR